MFFFFNDTATTEIYTLSLHDALPIYLFELALDLAATGFQRHKAVEYVAPIGINADVMPVRRRVLRSHHAHRSEEHTSELQSRQYLVCRLLLEKKKRRIGLCAAPEARS